MDGYDRLMGSENGCCKGLVEGRLYQIVTETAEGLGAGSIKDKLDVVSASLTEMRLAGLMDGYMTD